VLYGIENKPLYMKFTLLLLANNPVFTLWVSAEIMISLT